MSEFEDGTSKTAAASEVLTIPGTVGSSTNGDTRGVLHFGAGSMYMHDFPPNYIDSNSVVKDQTRYCVDAHNAPCQDTADTWKGAWRHFARSAHVGGVNLMMVDTSVRFISDDINVDAWQAMSTPRGGETTNTEI